VYLGMYPGSRQSHVAHFSLALGPAFAIGTHLLSYGAPCLHACCEPWQPRVGPTAQAGFMSPWKQTARLAWTQIAPLGRDKRPRLRYLLWSISPSAFLPPWVDIRGAHGGLLAQHSCSASHSPVTHSLGTSGFIERSVVDETSVSPRSANTYGLVTYSGDYSADCRRPLLYPCEGIAPRAELPRMPLFVGYFQEFSQRRHCCLKYTCPARHHHIGGESSHSCLVLLIPDKKLGGAREPRAGGVCRPLQAANSVPAVCPPGSALPPNIDACHNITVPHLPPDETSNEECASPLPEHQVESRRAVARCGTPASPTAPDPTFKEP